MKALSILALVCWAPSAAFLRRPVVSRTSFQQVVEQPQIVDPIVSSDSFVTQAFDRHGPEILPATEPTTTGGRTFPLSLIVNHESLKQALMIAAVNPSCSVIIEGRRGSCKSVLARSLHRLLPPCIRRISGHPYNIDPEGTSVDSFLASQLQEMDKKLVDLKTEWVPTPMVTVPLGVTEDALLGSVDLEQSLETGQTVFSPGLLPKAHRGVLYIDEINLLDEEVASLLFQVIADGKVTVEREGMSVEYPCQPLVIASYNPAEGEMRPHLLDRFALQMSSDEHEFTVDERVRVVENVEAFAGTSDPMSQLLARKRLTEAEKEEKELVRAVIQAREKLSVVGMTSDQILYLCETATRAGCVGQRAEIYSTLVAKASAALGGRQRVNAGDLELGVLLAIAPRARYWIEPAQKQDAAQQPQQSPDAAHPAPIIPPDLETFEQQRTEEEEEEQTDESLLEESEPKHDEEEETNEDNETLEIPLEFMFGVDATPIDPRLLAFAKQKSRKGRSGKHSRKFNIERGRFVKAIFPRGNRGRLAVGATLRAAAPHQKRRRLRIRKRPDDNRLVFILKDDFRIQQLKKKTGSLIIFVVDSSGSMALNRMAAAKGAAVSLLEEAYKSRDKVALVEFHGDHADMLVPPTKSMTLAKRRLEAMPCGAKTPLAHALMLAVRAGLNAIKVKQDCGKVVVVLISDGRANIPLCISYGDAFDTSNDPMAKDGIPSRAFLKDEVMVLAKQIGALDDFNLLCIDTEDRFVKTGFLEELARAAQGNYCLLGGSLDSRAVSRVVKEAI